MNNHPTSETRYSLATLIGANARELQVWIQNRRAKEKKISIQSASRSIDSPCYEPLSSDQSHYQEYQNNVLEIPMKNMQLPNNMSRYQDDTPFSYSNDTSSPRSPHSSSYNFPNPSAISMTAPLPPMKQVNQMQNNRGPVNHLPICLQSDVFTDLDAIIQCHDETKHLEIIISSEHHGRHRLKVTFRSIDFFHFTLSEKRISQALIVLNTKPCLQMEMDEDSNFWSPVAISPDMELLELRISSFTDTLFPFLVNVITCNPELKPKFKVNVDGGIPMDIGHAPDADDDRA